MSVNLAFPTTSGVIAMTHHLRDAVVNFASAPSRHALTEWQNE